MREDVLARDLTDVRYRQHGCKVESGTLADPYTGKTIHFVRGARTSSAVQIDHVVALENAWRSGASTWDQAKRYRFGNDMYNLLAVDGPANQEKGSASAAYWLPTNGAYRCEYVARQMYIAGSGSSSDSGSRSGAGCKVKSGVLSDPYTGTTIRFTRGVKTSSAVQIDHVVALENAWQSGANQWDRTKRYRFGNDMYNLLAVDGPANQEKGSASAAYWLPTNGAYRCDYVARQIGVKAKYGLTVTTKEKRAMLSVLRACPAQSVPER